MINERIQLSTQKIFSKRAEAFRGALELLFDKYEQGTQLSEELTIIVDFFLCLSIRSRGDENYEEEADAYGSQPSKPETETCMKTMIGTENARTSRIAESETVIVCYE